MLRIHGIRTDIKHDSTAIKAAVLKKLGIKEDDLISIDLVKLSLDARNKADIFYSAVADVSLKNEKTVFKRSKNKNIVIAPDERYKHPKKGSTPLKHRPIIIGSGPSGLFAAYYLSAAGFRPIVLERGDMAYERVRKAEAFFNGAPLDPESNVQFGEGGAGTFSDGKLSTGIKDPSGRKKEVLGVFVKHGAPNEILYSNKPHLGTDILVKIITGMRNTIIENGGEFHFNTRFTGFYTEGGNLKKVYASGGKTFDAEIAVLAIGNSARDTFEYLIRDSDIKVEAKPFAVGVRAEHRQEDINVSQYGLNYDKDLPPADYKLTYKTSNGTPVYSFCMCPGGYVIDSSSEAGFLCINGMSYSGRDSLNANAAIVAAVSPSDDPLENIAFQRMLEKKAFIEGQGSIPSQRLEDLENKRASSCFGSITPLHKGNTRPSDIRNILPDRICEDIIEAMHYFGTKIKGFDSPDTLLSAVESRTSSPVRIVRDLNMQSSVKGIFPVGEGAGYAGGITSAAIDGIKAYEIICSAFDPDHIE